MNILSARMVFSIWTSLNCVLRFCSGRTFLPIYPSPRASSVRLCKCNFLHGVTKARDEGVSCYSSKLKRGTSGSWHCCSVQSLCQNRIVSVRELKQLKNSPVLLEESGVEEGDGKEVAVVGLSGRSKWSWKRDPFNYDICFPVDQNH